MPSYLKIFCIIWLTSTAFCAFTTPLKSDAETPANYNETCDIIENKKGANATCPSERSNIANKVRLRKIHTSVKVSCNASENNAINYLQYLPYLGEVYDLNIAHCNAFKELISFSQLLWNATPSELTITNDFGVKLTAQHLHGLTNLTSIKIRYSNLTTLEADCFQSLHVVHTIIISGNKLRHAAANIFKDTKELLILDMESNSFKRLPERLFNDLHTLEILNLQKNELATLPDNIFRDTDALTTLFLGKNKLSAINERLFAPLKRLKYLDLSGNRLLSVHSHAFSHNQHLGQLHLNNNNIELPATHAGFAFPKKLRHLHLEGNALTRFNSAWFSACKSLAYVNVSHNSIKQNALNDFIILNKSQFIMDLSHNQISEINFPQLNYNHLRKSVKKAIYLSHNPWHCDCQSKHLFRFVKDNAKIIADLTEVRCNDTSFTKNIFDLETADICPHDQTFTTLLIVVACFSALVGLLLALYYKYHQEITIWLYAHDMCLRYITETELDRGKIYDAFISYSSKDEQFIAEHLHKQLEQGRRPFRLCIHTRDWLVGEVIADQIMRSIELSRRTIIVLSQNFITSSWSLMEFRAAHQAALNEGRVRVIIIIYGEITDMEHLDPLLKSYLSMHTYLKWGDPWFWEKLRYAMPHPRRSGADVRPYFENVELNRLDVPPE